MKRPIRDLWQEVIKSPGNRELLREVQERSGEVVDYFDHAGFAQETGQHILNKHPEWIAEIYGAIAGEEEPSPEELATIEALNRANQEQEIAIGHAFSEALMSNLTDDLKAFRPWIDDLRQVEEDERRELYSSPVVRAGQPYAERLALYGMTPLTVFYATEAVSGLLDRFMRYNVLASDSVVFIDAEYKISKDQLNTHVPDDVILQEVAHVSECSEYAAHVLLPWMFEVTRIKRFLFGGFEAKPVDQATRLIRAPSIDNLFERWNLK
ncbi:MAG: hypothetical protein ETSY2_21005 [Candidatus Entotheonella gemina]|uniref:Uncharacterized protein n=1 Tax=Candidatus Entotheonella gemina TaxID=1429439 RepID=W4M829_9BACT|nr:MAG: hypothetical protein ETSY2_21005 [Candidatus Entotheonella gemina]